MLSAILSKVIEQIQDLPESIQDELAEQFMEDIESEILWQSTLSVPQENNVLEEIARKALRESEEGRTREIGFDEL
jgi:hypothetical protein